MKNINYKDIKKDSIKFITIAEAGAMGSGGEVQLLTLNEDGITLFSGNMFYGFRTIDLDEFFKITPQLENFSCFVGMPFNLPKGWEYFYLGFGNNLLVSKDVSEYFKLLIKDKEGSGLYGSWLNFATITLILLDKGYISKEKFLEKFDEYSKEKAFKDDAFEYRQISLNKKIKQSIEYKGTEIEILSSDITKLRVHAIVNAAGNNLIGGSGVAGAISFAAGPEFMEECKSLNGCETGKAKITKGYNLPTKYVIHAVGPVYCRNSKKQFLFFGKTKEEKLLESCYISILDLAKEHNLKTIAIPAISCGAYGFPVESASEIAVSTIQKYLDKYNGFKKIILVDKNENVLKEYYKILFKGRYGCWVE